MIEDEDVIIEHERFCVNCGVWFDDERLTCSNCNQVKVMLAATRVKEVDDLETIKRKLGIKS